MAAAAVKSGGFREEDEDSGGEGNNGSGGQGLDTQHGSDSFLFMSFLDEVEDRVEELRRSALSLSQERDSLLTIISQLRDDRLRYSLTLDESNEMLTNIEHLKKRCETVEINISTPRTAEQESSYLVVNSLVKDLEHTCWLGNTESQTHVHQAQCYLNACVSDGSSHGPVDYKFQGMILGCNLTDQKLVRQRLECLVKGTVPSLHYLKQLQNSYVDNGQHQPDDNSLPADTASSNSHSEETARK